ncbi:NAD+ synthase, partial [Dehalococcoidia bacterium]|nr:NAD+ synthase [Dehalococcoidia bacterium]
DEKRYFKPGTECPVYVVDGVGIGVNICEDIWYNLGPTEVQQEAGAELIVNINASPYHAGKQESREQVLASRAIANELLVSYTNMVGGQDELVFDGASTVFNQHGELVGWGGQFEEELVVVDLNVGPGSAMDTNAAPPKRRNVGSLRSIGTASKVHVSEYKDKSPSPSFKQLKRQTLSPIAEVYRALVLGTRDYIHKSGFRKVLVGLSGGIDSSITAAIAAEALGKSNVVGVAMPSRYSSEESMADAKLIVRNLGIELMVIPIEPAFTAYLGMLTSQFRGTDVGVAEENLQARVRGNTLMALSNKFDWMVLTTGNKSELATGYSTLYGDMAGGFAVIKDVPKTLVYELANYLNTRNEMDVIPKSVINKAPSAELRPNQYDQDSLPLYSILDPILKAYVEEDATYEEILNMGYDAETVQKAIQLVDRSEYKRRQAPPGIKITPRNFGRDRRMPLVNKYRHF